MTQSKLALMLFAACIALAACNQPQQAAPAEPVVAPAPAPAPAPPPPPIAGEEDEADTPHAGGDKVTPSDTTDAGGDKVAPSN